MTHVGPVGSGQSTKLVNQIAVLGNLLATCEARGLAMHVFPWNSRMDAAGFERDAVYLVRPDGYVAWAAARGAAAIASYLDARGIGGSSSSPARAG